MNEKFTDNILLVGQSAPAFKAKAFSSLINFPEDYIGKWVVLFSLPRDFTSSLVLESTVLLTILNDFEKMNTQLIGLCIDSVYNYIYCLEIYKQMAVSGIENYESKLPIIEDLEKNIAKKFCMIQASDQFCLGPIQTAFIIDPRAKVRCIINYSDSTWKNFHEIQHIVLALQKTDMESR